MDKKSKFLILLRIFRKILPGNYLKTLFYLNFIKRPRKFLRSIDNTFYRFDHIYDVLKEFKDVDGYFSILEFGVAEGASFTKHLFATKYLKMNKKVMVYGFDSFEGLPEVSDKLNEDLVTRGNWVTGQFKGNYEELNSYCKEKYPNFCLYKGLFDFTMTDTVLENFKTYKPILIWIDCDYYSSAKVVFEKLIPFIPNGCVVYFDEFDNINYGSRFTGESRLIYEINNGQFGDGIELILDKNLSFDSNRIYRFINFSKPIRYNFKIESPEVLQKRTNDSPLP